MNPAEAKHRPSLLLVDDDPLLASTLARALYDRGYQVTVAHDTAQALKAIAEEVPDYAVVDLKIRGESGLALLPKLRQAGPETRMVVLTGYGSIATAVQAVKLGANEYLTKPTDADAIVAALRRDGADPLAPLPERQLSPDQLEWEYIQRVLIEHGGNVSATANALGMHRRSLQRKLGKRPPRRG